MRIQKRINKLEKLLPTIKNANEDEYDNVCEWLAQNSEEFRECVRQLFRLQCSVGQSIDTLEQWKEPYQEKAKTYNIRIKQLIKENKHVSVS